MRAHEIINESITFSVGKLREENGQKHFSDPWQKKVTKPCWVCDGTGIQKPWPGDEKQYKCEYCHGNKEIEEWESTAPELNVSNTNAFEILKMLGLTPDEQDYAGIIPKEKLPEVMRNLIKLKNGDISQHIEEPGLEKREMKVRKDDETGVTHIEPQGPKMFNGGRTPQQVSRYLDNLIRMIKFAQQNDATIGWG